MIDYAWIAKRLLDVAFTWQPRDMSCWFRIKKGFISGNLAIWTVHVLGKVLFQCFWVPWETIFMLLEAKLSDRCFCWFPDGHQIWRRHKNLYKFGYWKFLCISSSIHSSRLPWAIIIMEMEHYFSRKRQSHLVSKRRNLKILTQIVLYKERTLVPRMDCF